MNNYNVIGSSSKGNAVIYRERILVDCGITYKKLEEHIDNIDLILLTHKHKDHLRLDTLSKITKDIKIICPEWLYDDLIEANIKNVIKISMNKIYNYKGIKFSAFYLYHNVDNCGYRIFDNEYKIFHATDTAHLNGIKAKDYDLYAIEHNYDANTIENLIDEKLAKHQYSYEVKAVENHMSFQTATKWILRNMGKHSEVLKLHISSRYYDKGKLIIPDEIKNLLEAYYEQTNSD